jgi:hypothetical protein
MSQADAISENAFVVAAMAGALDLPALRRARR